MTGTTLKIKKVSEGERLTVFLTGEINTVTVKQLEAELGEPDCKELIFDLEELHYMTSSGIRLMLRLLKQMTEKGGTLRIVHMQEAVQSIFSISGLLGDFVRE